MVAKRGYGLRCIKLKFLPCERGAALSFTMSTGSTGGLKLPMKDWIIVFTINIQLLYALEFSSRIISVEGDFKRFLGGIATSISS